MSSIKEITVFSIGDSNDLSTWSNVPYFFTKTLEQKGYKVNRVNIEEDKTRFKIYKYSVFAGLKLFYRNSNHTYFRSQSNYKLTNRKIEQALQEHPNTDLAVFLTFSFSAPRSFKKKVVLFGDWTYLYYIQQFKKRGPYWFERAALQREKQHIEGANAVLGLFPLSSVFIKEKYEKANAHYLGNVINCNYKLTDDIIKTKISSKKLLFIGNRKYLNGALELIEEFKKLKLKHNELELHLIGINKEDTNMEGSGIFYHGYLNKSVSSENEHYYNLLSEARVIINTTKDWGGFSALSEAMYFYTPVITRAYDEFTETFGKSVDFGFYVEDRVNLNAAIESVLSQNENEQLRYMNAAHEKVKGFTWENYIERLMKLV